MILYELKVQRFRGIRELSWRPTPGINCLIGPADIGKTTILSSIALLLSPRPPSPPSEYDYFERLFEDGFEIYGVLGGLSEEVMSSSGPLPLQGWLAGSLQPLPDEGGAEPVLVCRVTGTPDFDVIHELIDANGDSRPFSVALRRRLGFIRLPTEDVARNELRLGRGSLLEREIGSHELRGPLSRALSAASADLDLPKPVQEAIARLHDLFLAGGLPADLMLGAVSPEGGALLGLLGLLEGESSDKAIPVFRAGAGTRRVALLKIAALAAGELPIIAVDEPEMGLEPYRQRGLVVDIRGLVDPGGQAFLTTHSSAVVGALQSNELWRVDRDGVRELADPLIQKVMRSAPDALLSRLPVLSEGATEAGFLYPLLNRLSLRDRTVSLDDLGVRLVAREGQPSIFNEAGSLIARRIECGAFVDNEDEHTGRRETLAGDPLCAFGTWDEVRNLEEALARWLPRARLGDLVALASQALRRSEASLLQQVGEAAGKPGTASVEDLLGGLGEPAVREAIALAMQKGNWFKSYERGLEVGNALLEWGVPGEIESVIDKFWTEVASRV